MIVYTVDSEAYGTNNNVQAYTSKAKALKEARRVSRGGDDAIVKRLTLADMPTLHLICALIDGEGFVAKEDVIATINGATA